MKSIRELQTIFDSIHNVNSTAHLTIEVDDPEPDNWMDKHILRYF